MEKDYSHIAAQHRHRARLAGIPDEHNTLDSTGVRLVLASGQCSYCHRRASLEVDHVVPLNRTGATNTVAACVPSCRRCNSSRGSKRLAEWDGELHQQEQYTLPSMPPIAKYG